MRLLLDTHVVLAAGGASSRLPSRVTELLLDEKNVLFLSSVSAWEVASKHILGKLPLAVSPIHWLARISEDLDSVALPFRTEHALEVGGLPLLHRDPFDRMLVCQARSEGLILLTSDEMIRQYDVPTLW